MFAVHKMQVTEYLQPNQNLKQMYFIMYVMLKT